MNTLIAPFINVVALVAVLAYFLRKPLADFVVSRHHQIKEELRDAQGALAVAKAGSEQLALRLATLEAEVLSLKSAAQQEALKSKNAILAGATELARGIVTDASAASAAFRREFREELQRELAGLAVARAEVRLKERLTGEDRARIRSEFSSLVEKAQ